jgi:WD40 repeat protein
MAAAPSLLASASFTRHTSPRRTTTIGDVYVLEIARTASHYVASASGPKNTIHLFDRSSFAPVRALAGHEGGTSALTVAHAASSSVAGGHALFSCGKDARVKVWDERTGTVGLESMCLLSYTLCTSDRLMGSYCIVRTSGRPRALLSLDVASDGHMLATGTELTGDDVCIHFFDLRSPAAPLRTHSQTHSEDITVVKFAPAGERLLLSASSDGLVCTSNPEEQDEDEAGVHAGNWGCSIARAGWIEAKGGAMAWAASDMETFSLWSEEVRHRRLRVFDDSSDWATWQLDLVQSLDVRQLSMDGQTQWTTDYLIGAHTSSSQLHSLDNGLRLFLGSNERVLYPLCVPPVFLQGLGVR